MTDEWTLKDGIRRRQDPRARVGFYEGTGADRRCRVCGQAGGHNDACPVLELGALAREQTAHLGIFVANMRETLEAFERLTSGRDRDE